jgi:hypothetical protein
MRFDGRLHVELNERDGVRAAKSLTPETGLDDDVGTPDHTQLSLAAGERDMAK